jgi:hypothetical protein
MNSSVSEAVVLCCQENDCSFFFLFWRSLIMHSIECGEGKSVLRLHQLANDFRWRDQDQIDPVQGALELSLSFTLFHLHKSRTIATAIGRWEMGKCGVKWRFQRRKSMGSLFVSLSLLYSTDWVTIVLTKPRRSSDEIETTCLRVIEDDGRKHRCRSDDDEDDEDDVLMCNLDECRLIFY